MGEIHQYSCVLFPVSAEAKPDHRHKGQGVQTPWYSPEAVCAALGNLSPGPTSETHESGGESRVGLARRAWSPVPTPLCPESSHARALHRLSFPDLTEACCVYSSFCTWRNCTVRGARNWTFSRFMLSGQSAAEWLTVGDLGRIGIHCDPHVGQSLLGVKASRCEVEDFLVRRIFFF